jgi:hypothetical protein
MKKKYVYVIDAAILVGTLIGLYFAFFSAQSPLLLLSPSGEPNELFRFDSCQGDCWILIDSLPNFASPEKYYLEENLEINLSEGIYYWKVEGFFESQTIKLTTLTNVSLIVLKRESSYVVVNNGDGELAVNVYNQNNESINNFSLTSNAIRRMSDE